MLYWRILNDKKENKKLPLFIRLANATVGPCEASIKEALSAQITTLEASQTTLNNIKAGKDPQK